MTVETPERRKGGRPKKGSHEAARVALIEADVVKRRIAGESFYSIDKNLGITNSDRVFHRAAEKMRHSSREDAYALELARLDQLTETFHGVAVEHADVKAAGVALGVHDRRAKLQGLNHSDRVADEQLRINGAMVQLQAAALVGALDVLPDLTPEQKRAVVMAYGQRVQALAESEDDVL